MNQYRPLTSMQLLASGIIGTVLGIFLTVSVVHTTKCSPVIGFFVGFASGWACTTLVIDLIKQWRNRK